MRVHKRILSIFLFFGLLFSGCKNDLQKDQPELSFSEQWSGNELIGASCCNCGIDLSTANEYTSGEDICDICENSTPYKILEVAKDTGLLNGSFSTNKASVLVKRSIFTAKNIDLNDEDILKIHYPEFFEWSNNNNPTENKDLTNNVLIQIRSHDRNTHFEESRNFSKRIFRIEYEFPNNKQYLNKDGQWQKDQKTLKLNEINATIKKYLETLGIDFSKINQSQSTNIKYIDDKLSITYSINKKKLDGFEISKQNIFTQDHTYHTWNMYLSNGNIDWFTRDLLEYGVLDRIYINSERKLLDSVENLKKIIDESSSKQLSKNIKKDIGNLKDIVELLEKNKINTIDYIDNVTNSYNTFIETLSNEKSIKPTVYFRVFNNGKEIHNGNFGSRIDGYISSLSEFIERLNIYKQYLGKNEIFYQANSHFGVPISYER